MRQLISASWPAPGPQSIAYFCGPMPLPPLEPGGDDPLAEALGSAWLKANIHGLWSGVPANGDLTDVLVSSFFRANTDPSERYVLVLPGSLDHRRVVDTPPHLGTGVKRRSHAPEDGPDLTLPVEMEDGILGGAEAG